MSANRVNPTCVDRIGPWRSRISGAPLRESFALHRVRTHSLLMLVSHPRFGEARRDRGERRLTQVVPPRQPEAGRIESEEYDQRQVRTSGRGDRGAKAARDQVAAASADCTDKSERSGGLEAGGFQSDGAGGLAQSFRLPALLLAEDRGNHPVGRAVADPGRDEEHQEHCQKAGKIFNVNEVHDANRGGAHDDEVPERDDRAADFVAEPSAKRTREGTHQWSQEGYSHRDLRELSLYQQRKRGGVADKRSERSDVNVRHHPGVLALDDDELLFETRARRGEVVHKEMRADRREGERQDPHQSGVLKIKTSRDRGCLIETHKAEPEYKRGQ